jgi:integrase
MGLNPMAHLRLQHVHTFRKGGRTYHYFRKGAVRVRLPGSPGSAEFMAAYHAAQANEQPPIGASRAAPGSMSSLAVDWYASPAFTGLRAPSQRTYRRLLENFLKDHGDRIVAHAEPLHILKIIADMGGTPAQANALRNVLRSIFQYAFERGLRRDNPMRDVRRLKYVKAPYRMWEEEHIEQYRAHHPSGSSARLALELLVNTSQRRGDIIRMGPQHIRNGMLHVRQQKTGEELRLPIHADLAAELPTEAGHLVFLTTEAGAAFKSGNGFYNKFKGWCTQAGLPTNLSPHGLRKAAARRLAEAGCTPHEIMSITGHKTLAEVERYTRAADKTRLAVSANARMSRVPEE